MTKENNVPALIKPTAIFFDWDGTLADSFEFLYKAHNYTRGQFSMPNFSLEKWRGYFGQPREKLYAELYGIENIETAKMHFLKYVSDHHLKELHPMFGAKKLLETCAELGIICGVVTNKKSDLVAAEIKNFGWEHFFKSVIGAGDAASDKPSDAPLILAIEKAGVSAERESIWFVGDTDNDALCANKANTPMVFIGSKTEINALPDVCKIALHKNNCEELHDYLLQYKK